MEESVSEIKAENAVASCAHKAGGRVVLLLLLNRWKTEGEWECGCQEGITRYVYRPPNPPPLSTKDPQPGDCPGSKTKFSTVET